MLDRPRSGERALLVHIGLNRPCFDDETQEFRALAESAGAEVVGERSGRDPVRRGERRRAGHGLGADADDLVAGRGAQRAGADRAEVEVAARVQGHGGIVVFQTDLAADDLPVDESGDVAESDEFAPVDEIEDIAVDATPELVVDLDAGRYVLICNVPAHYRQGMSTPFTVN